jgi:membrane-bound serine protease (ClpP class)
LSLILFEFFTGGVGIAGGVGVVALVLSIHGLGLLPTRPIGVVLGIAAFLAFAVDAQTTMPKVWTAIGTALLVAASLLLFGTTDGRRFALPWWVIALMTVGTVVFMVTAVPTATRARFSTPVVDRGPLVGVTGTVARSVDGSDGVVEIDATPWPALAAEGAGLLVGGTAVRVVAVDGYRLAVEPLAGS